MTWTKIKAILSHPLIKVSYVILIGLPIVFEILEANNIVPKAAQMVYNIYYSSVLLIASYIIYSLFVPTIIRKYKDDDDYKNKLKPSLLEYNPEKRKNIVLAHLDETEENQSEQIKMLLRTIDSELDPEKKKGYEEQLKKIVDPVYPGCVNRFLEKEWLAKDSSRKVALIGCFIINLIAIGLTVWVCYERIKIVVSNNLNP